jgi:Tfp pilus assembly protein PilO
MITQIVILIFTNFTFDEIPYHMGMSLIIALIFVVVFLVGYGWIIGFIQSEAREEMKVNMAKENSFKEMFDSI